MSDYIAVDQKLRKDVLDVKAVRGMVDVLDYYVVLAKIKIKGRWQDGRTNGKANVSKVKQVKGWVRKEVRERKIRKEGMQETERRN